MAKIQVLAITGWPSWIKVKKDFFGTKEQWDGTLFDQLFYFSNEKFTHMTNREELEFYDTPTLQIDPRTYLISQIWGKREGTSS